MIGIVYLPAASVGVPLIVVVPPPRFVPVTTMPETGIGSPAINVQFTNWLRFVGPVADVNVELEFSAAPAERPMVYGLLPEMDAIVGEAPSIVPASDQPTCGTVEPPGMVHPVSCVRSVVVDDADVRVALLLVGAFEMSMSVQ